MPEPGDPGSACPRCDTGTVLIGHGHAVFGNVCPSCDLIRLLPTQEVAGGLRVELDGGGDG